MRYDVLPESKDARIARLERELEAAISRLSEACSENATLWEMLTDIERWADAIKNRAQGKRLVHKYEQAKAEREAVPHVDDLPDSPERYCAGCGGEVEDVSTHKCGLPEIPK